MANIGVIFGGQSPEHEVSLASACAIFAVAEEIPDHTFFEVGIGKDGSWYGKGSLSYLIDNADKTMLFARPLSENYEVPEKVSEKDLISSFDLLFPITHGGNGENGQLQGLLEFYKRSFIGCGIISSALAANKSLLKRFLYSQGFPVTPGILIDTSISHSIDEWYCQVISEIGNVPLFIKPNSGGSSIGIGMSSTMDEFEAAIGHAKRFDDLVLVEKRINQREFVVGVIESLNGELIVSDVGECFRHGDIYNYKEKYLTTDKKFVCPANISSICKSEMQRYAESIFSTLLCTGMTRIDFFLDQDEDSIIVNEVNTIPGFTPQSAFPRIFKNAGLSLSGIVRTMIDRAMHQH